jgi:hypothetical protein
MYNKFFIIIFIFFNIICLFPAGTNESNNVVLAVKEYKDNLPFYVYKKKEQLWISVYQEVGNKKYDIRHFPIKNINIQSEYSIYSINNIVFLYTNEVLHKIKIDINRNDFMDKKNNELGIVERRIIDINNVWFYDNHCFYRDKSGEIYIYDEKRDDFNNYNKYQEIIPPPEMTNSVILNTNLLAESAKEAGNYWFQEFNRRLSKIDITNKTIDEILSDDDKFFLNRYKNIFRNSYPGTNDPVDLKVWIVDMQKKYKELDKEKIKMRHDFLEKWKITPSDNVIEELSFKEIVKICSSWIPNGLEVEEDTVDPENSELVIRLPPKKNADKSDIIKTDKIIFGDNNLNSEILNFYVLMYNDLIDLEKKLYRDANGKITDNSMELLNINYDFYKEAIVLELKKQLDALHNAYIELKDNFKKKDNEFNEEMVNINHMEFTVNDIKKKDFDYTFLPAIQNENESIDSYTILYHNLLKKTDYLNNFENLGQITNLLGIIDKYIYTCDGGGLILYDTFTLLEKYRYEFNKNENGKLLFSINQKKNFFITVEEESKGGIYYLGEIQINNEMKFEKIKKDNIISNTAFIENKFPNPFYSYVFEDKSGTNKIYVNRKKIVLPFGKGIKTKKGFKYIEARTGAGIILQ